MDWIAWVLIPLVKALVLLVLLLTAFAYLSYVERKLVARFHVRYGPNRAGPFGLLQPLADALKMLFKEEIIPRHVDKLSYLAAPAMVVVPALLVWAVIPISNLSFRVFGYEITFYLTDLNVGLLYVLAVAELGTYGIVVGGWSSNNKYALLGALRTSSQMLSYTLPMGVALLSMVTIAGSFSLLDIVNAQRGLWFVVLQPLGFLIYFIAGLAETNRSPFDLPETENELVAGFTTEYGGMKFALFYMGEYINMITISALATTFFLGGWWGPFAAQLPILGIFYFVLKVAVMIFVIIWVRASLPRVRYDQLMRFCWKFLLPLALVNLMVTATAVAIWG
ncbi:MAG: NADH-quinone oxidoreductase subunit NuoH [Anaerolineae bacterium]|nr:NADH-quinone oxidoreductase subunit NuoH [Anaerolineae bacterium]MDW8072301.1 NADH-quinone oxidoreductase subunit NuoH [Anaerolineae bacterium]